MLILQMLKRILGTLRLNADTLEDVEYDHSAIYQAILIVAMASISAADRALLAERDMESPWVLVMSIFGGMIAWTMWVLCIRIVGNSVFNVEDTRACWGRLFRTTGFAMSPGIFSVFVFLPIIGNVIYYVVYIWTLVCLIFAVRRGTDYRSTLRALMVVLLAFIPMVLLIAIINILIYPLLASLDLRWLV